MRILVAGATGALGKQLVPRLEAAGHEVFGMTRTPAKQDLIRGWYDLAGGGAGFLLIETDDLRDLTAILRPYMDLMSFDVRGVYQLDYAQRIEELRQVATQST